MNDNLCVLMLDVYNHPGVMSHITSLFSRRAFNLEGILCGRIGSTEDKSRIYLLVKKDDNLEQIIHQLEKLYDVLYIAVCENCNVTAFDNISKIIEDY